ncbi:MAG: nitrate reductase [Gammaproteobacteria bacterium]|nr:MAG: nitrate reductase [Gammaproteobacteria bacterium]
MKEAVRPVATTCAYCGVGCGIQAHPASHGQPARVKGLDDHPANFGRLCSKGSALAETLGSEERLLHPEVDGRQTDWQTALDETAARLMAVRDAHGPESIAFYLSGQLLTEDYYVANKLMKGFIGSPHVDTNSRLCMSSSVAGHKRAFGTDTVPNCYEDIELADLVVITGSNMAWCHPVLFQRLKAARAARPEMKIVVIDPRRTDTCDIADLHLAVQPGSDGWLFTGLLAWLGRQGALDYAWLEAHTEGFGPAIQHAQRLCPDLHSIAQATGLKEADISRFYSWFTTRPNTVTLYSQGIHQTSSGSDKVNAILNCHLATGRIGKPGCGPLSLTGQPNAMGGREVGGLANQLAAHLDFTPEALNAVGTFWQAPNLVTGPGKTATEIFEGMLDGSIRAVWIMGTNPAVSLPDGDRIRDALQRCPLVIVSDCIATADTLNYAHIALPAAGWSEKDGTVTNSERRISRQRAFRPAMGEARPDWWIMTQVAQRMGFGRAFEYQTPADIFREHAALSGYRNTPGDLPRDFDISALSEISDDQYDTLMPIQWPVTDAAPCGTARLFAEGGFFTPTGKARLLGIEPEGPAHVTDARFPFALNTGRLRDQWHTMTRTALAPRLNQHHPEPALFMHPADLPDLSLQTGDLAEVTSRWGRAVLRVMPDEGVQPGHAFAPMHWTARFAPFSRINTVVNPAVDPYSKQPEFKHTPVAIQPVRVGTWLTLISTREPTGATAAGLYTARTRLKNGWQTEVALADLPGDDLKTLIKENFPESGADTTEWLEYHDAAHRVHRVAALLEGRLVAVAYLQAMPPTGDRTALHALLSVDTLDAMQRMSLLAGKPLAGQPCEGRTVCACFGVGESRILALKQEGADSVEAISTRTQAGTNCGSCLPEIKRLLKTGR